MEEDILAQLTEEERQLQQVAFMQFSSKNEYERMKRMQNNLEMGNMEQEQMQDLQFNEQGPNAANQKKRNIGVPKKEKYHHSNSLKNVYEVENLNLEDELGMQSREIDFIKERTSSILTKDNLDELNSIYVQLQSKVSSLYNSEQMIKASDELLNEFYKNFQDTIITNAQLNGKLIFNRFEELFNKKYSVKTERDMIRITMNIINKCYDSVFNNKHQIVNQLEIISQFQKYIMTGILTNVNSNIFRCISEFEFNAIIHSSMSEFIKENEQPNNVPHENGNAADAFNDNNAHNIEQLQNEAYIIEKRYMDFTLEQVFKFCKNIFEVFRKKILEGVKITYEQQLGKIKLNLETASKYITKMEHSNDKNQQMKEYQKRLNESFLKNLSRAILFKKAQQNLSQIIDEFENLNKIVNTIITGEISDAVNQISEIQGRERQPIFFSNLFDHMIDFMIRSFAQNIIPRSLERLLDDKGSLEHVKKSIQEKYNEKYKKFLSQSSHQQNEDLKRILDTQFFTQYDAQIKKLISKSNEWLFYFVDKMSELDSKNDNKNKFTLMLHQITFGKLKQIKEYQQEMKNLVEKNKRTITQLWQDYQRQALECKIKGFEFQSLESSNMFESEILQNDQIILSLQEDSSKIEYKIQFQNVEIKSQMVLNSGKKREIIDIFKYLIHAKDLNIILTLFFFFHYEKIQGLEVKINDFNNQQFQDYLQETISQSKNIVQFYGLAEQMKKTKYPYEIQQFQKKVNVLYDSCSIHLDDFERKVQQNQLHNPKPIFYNQHYVNENNQLTAFFSGSSFQKTIVGVENYVYNLEDSTNYLLCFSNYYCQFLFTELYTENYFKNKLEILFFHFCQFIQIQYDENQFKIELDDELFSLFNKKYEQIQAQLEVPLSVAYSQYEEGQKWVQQMNNGYSQQEIGNMNGQINSNHSINENGANNEGNQASIKPLYHELKNLINNSPVHHQPQSVEEGIEKRQQEEQELRLRELSLKNQIENEQNQLVQLTEKIDELQQQLQEKEEEYKQHIEDLQKKNDNQRDEISKKEQYINDLNIAEQNYIRQIEDLNQNQPNQPQQPQQNNNNLAQIQNEEYIKAIEDNCTKKMQESQQQVHDLQQQLEQTQIELSDQEAAHKRIFSQIQQSKEEQQRILTQKQELSKQIIEKEQQLQQNEQQLQIIKDQLALIHQQNEELSQRNNQLTHQISESIHYSNYEKWMQPLKNEINQFEVNHSKLLSIPLIANNYKANGEMAFNEENEEEQIDQSAVIKALFTEIKSLKNRMIKINRQTQYFNETFDQIQNNVQQLQNENNTLQNKCNNILNSEEYQEKIQKKKQEFESIEKQIELKLEQLNELTDKQNFIVENGVQNINLNVPRENPFHQENEELKLQLLQKDQLLEELRVEKDILLERISRLEQQQQLNQMNEEQQIIRGNEQLNTKLIELTNVNDEIKNKQQEIEELNEQILFLTDKLANLENIANQQVSGNNKEVGMALEDEGNGDISQYIQGQITSQLYQSEMKIHQITQNNQKYNGTINNLSQQFLGIKNTLEQRGEDLDQMQKDVHQLQNRTEEEHKMNIELDNQQFENQQEQQEQEQQQNCYSNQENQQNQQEEVSLNGLDTLGKINYFQDFTQMNNVNSSPQEQQVKQEQNDDALTILNSAPNSAAKFHYYNEVYQNMDEPESDQQRSYLSRSSLNILKHNTCLIANRDSIENIPLSSSQSMRRSSNVITADFDFNIFYQIYHNAAARPQLVQFLKDKCTVCFEDFEKSIKDNQGKKLDLFFIDKTYNAFIQIEQPRGLFSSFQSVTAKCNTSIHQSFFNTNQAKQIVDHFGLLKKELILKNNLNKSYELEQLFMQYIIEGQHVNLFSIISFIGKGNIIPHVMIQAAEKFDKTLIDKIIISFEQDQNKSILVLVTLSPFIRLFRYFTKDENNKIKPLYETYIVLAYTDTISNNNHEWEFNIHPMLKKSNEMRQLPTQNKKEQVSLFLITYAPLILLGKQEINYLELNNIFGDIDKYNTFTLQNNFL